MAMRLGIIVEPKLHRILKKEERPAWSVKSTII